MTMYNVLHDAAKVGIKKVGERTSLLWTLCKKNGEGKTHVDEDLTCPVFFKKKRRGKTCGKCGQGPRLML